MARTLMDDLAVAAGYCCTFNMLENNQSISKKKLARHLGITEQALSHHAKRKAAGLLTRCYSCPKAVTEQVPVVLRKTSRGGNL